MIGFRLNAQELLDRGSCVKSKMWKIRMNLQVQASNQVTEVNRRIHYIIINTWQAPRGARGQPPWNLTFCTKIVNFSDF